MNDHAAMVNESNERNGHKGKRPPKRRRFLPNAPSGGRDDSFRVPGRDARAAVRPDRSDRIGLLAEASVEETGLRETNQPAGSQMGAGNAGIRLNKFMAQSGLCSRRKADELVEAGRVTLNGHVARAGDRVLPLDEVAVDGRPLGTREETVCLMLNKPPKVVSTASDPEGRATVLDFVPGKYRRLRLYPVGRLDYLSEGLILLTNDGALAQRLAHPSNNQRKVYEVEVKGSVTRATLATLGGGMPLQEGDFAAPCEVTVIARGAPEMDTPGPGASGASTRAASATNAPSASRASRASATSGARGDEKKGTGTTLLRFVLHQGLNRQIRRMCRDAGLSVRRLRRVAEGRLELGNLAPGKTRVLEEKELELLRADG